MAGSLVGVLFGGIRPLFGGAMSITLQVSVDRTVATDVYDTVVARQATDDTQITAESIAGAPSLAVHAFEERDCVDHEWPGTKCFGVLVRNGDDAAATMHLFNADGEDTASYPLDDFMRDWCTGLYRVPDVRQSAAGEEVVGFSEEGVRGGRNARVGSQSCDRDRIRSRPRRDRGTQPRAEELALCS